MAEFLQTVSKKRKKVQKKVAFHNLGCKVNAYETETMLAGLLEDGCLEVPFAPGADIYIINTCTVTNVADRKSRQMLHKAKEMNPDAVVVAVGCYVQDAGEVLKKDPAVDVIVGNNEKGKLTEILEEYFRENDKKTSGHVRKQTVMAEDASGQPGNQNAPVTENLQAKTDAAVRKSVHVGDIAAVREYEELPFAPAAELTRAFIKIQDGCNQFCSYCMIPYVRGRVRSRRSEEILKEAEALIVRGYREIVLTGIHISSYGLDFAAPGRNLQTPDASCAETNEALKGLIFKLCALPGLERLRLGSLEPGVMTEEFVRFLSENRTVCPAFHLSLQSGCDATLARMKRKYRTADFAEKCSLLRKYYDCPAIMTDVIAGFPGETEEEFSESAAFVRDIHFSRIHVFKYSKRRGTKAAEMPDQVPESVKKLRSDVLLGIGAEARKAYASSFLGQDIQILFEEQAVKNGHKCAAGYTGEYVQAFCFADGIHENEIKNCCAVSADENGIIAELKQQDKSYAKLKQEEKS